MSSITKKVSEVIRSEEKKLFSSPDLENVQQLIDEIKELGLEKTTQYTIPMSDTIGKGLYKALNNRK